MYQQRGVKEQKYKVISFDKTQTLGLKCMGNTTCVIYAKAKDGVPPYKYELYEENRTTKISGPDGTTLSLQDYTYDGNQIAAWVHGKLGDKFSIKMSDQCGNSFFQGVTITDLDVGGRIACVGSPICRSFKLYAQALGNADYEWNDPDGNVFSTERCPTVTNGKSGTYKVKVAVPECGNPEVREV